MKFMGNHTSVSKKITNLYCMILTLQIKFCRAIIQFGSKETRQEKWIIHFIRYSEFALPYKCYCSKRFVLRYRIFWGNKVNRQGSNLSTVSDVSFDNIGAFHWWLPWGWRLDLKFDILYCILKHSTRHLTSFKRR